MGGKGEHVSMKIKFSFKKEQRNKLAPESEREFSYIRRRGPGSPRNAAHSTRKQQQVGARYMVGHGAKARKALSHPGG